MWGQALYLCISRFVEWFVWNIQYQLINAALSLSFYVFKMVSYTILSYIIPNSILLLLYN